MKLVHNSIIGIFALVFSACIVAEEAENSIEGKEDLSLYFEGEEVKPVSANRFISPVMSFLIPGLGQLFNGEAAKASMHFAVSGSLMYFTRESEPDDDYLIEKAFVESNNKSAIFLNKDKLLNSTFRSLQLNTSFYSAFDAYRVATISQQKSGGVVPVSTESYTDLALAPFNPKYISDTYVFAPFVVGALFLIGRGTASKNKVDVGESTHYRYTDDIDKSSIIGAGLIKHNGVAVGEEAFFRGMVNTETMHYFGPTYGVIASSLIFGLSHSGEGVSAGAGLATVYGLYLGLVHKIKNGQLGYNVALHYWWNVSVTLATAERSRSVTIPVLVTQF